MKQHCTSLLSLTAGILFLFTSACVTAQVTQPLPSEQKPAAAQIPTASEQPFSAADTYVQTQQAAATPADDLTADNSAQDTKAAFRNLREQVKQQKISPVKKALVTTALKKMEKMQAKMEVKKVKAAKQAKVDPEYRTPIILGAIGLALLIIGAVTVLWPLYLIGSLALTAAVIWILLILLEVI